MYLKKVCFDKLLIYYNCRWDKNSTPSKPKFSTLPLEPQLPKWCKLSEVIKQEPSPVCRQLCSFLADETQSPGSRHPSYRKTATRPSARWPAPAVSTRSPAWPRLRFEAQTMKRRFRWSWSKTGMQESLFRHFIAKEASVRFPNGAEVSDAWKSSKLVTPMWYSHITQMVSQSEQLLLHHVQLSSTLFLSISLSSNKLSNLDDRGTLWRSLPTALVRIKPPLQGSGYERCLCPVRPRFDSWQCRS